MTEKDTYKGFYLLKDPAFIGYIGYKRVGSMATHVFIKSNSIEEVRGKIDNDELD